MKKQPIPGSLRLWQLVVFLIAPVLCALVCLCIGRMNVPVRDLVSLLLGREVGAQARAVLWSMRLPRVLLAALVGAGLSVSGCVFQSLFANPLATPDTLGVASGASFGAALALLLGFRLIGVQLTAFFFGMVAVSLTCLSGKARQTHGYHAEKERRQLHADQPEPQKQRQCRAEACARGDAERVGCGEGIGKEALEHAARDGQPRADQRRQ